MIALALGLARPAATEFSFLLGVPTLLAAGRLRNTEGSEGGGFEVGMDWTLVTLGLIASGISAFIVVKWLIRFVQSHNFNGFACVSVVLLGVCLLLYIAKGD